MHSLEMVSQLPLVFMLLISGLQQIHANPLIHRTVPEIQRLSPRYGASTYDTLNVLERRAVSSDCAVRVFADGYSTCQSFTTAYQFSMITFIALNPSVGTTCQNFKPGEEYCFRKSKISHKDSCMKPKD